MAGAQEDASKIDEKVRPFVMVHGTWGRGILFPGDHITRPDWWHLVPFLRRLAQPPWFSEGSQFRSTLQSELEKRNTRPDFHIFRWSGANSVFARDRAASELSKLIASQPHGSRTVVIAHSHGGNVAMRALNILGERAANIHLITLATPFLRIFPTWTGLHFGEVLLGVWFGMLILILSLASLLLHSFEPSNQFKEAVDAWLPYVIAIYLVVSLMLAGPIVYFFVNPRGASTLDRHKMPWLWRPFILAEATNFTASGARLLVLRGVYDEASLALATAKIGSSLSHFMTKTISGRLLPYVLAAMFICLYLLNNQNVGVLFLVAAAYFLSLLLLFFLFVPNLFNCIFGREFSLGASRCEIAADSAPDCKDAVVVTLEPPFLPEKNRSLTELYRWHSLPQEEFNAKMRELLAGNSRNDSSLRHAIYNNRECIPAIIEWLEEADLLGTKEDPCEKARRKLQHEQEHDTTNMRFDD